MLKEIAMGAAVVKFKASAATNILFKRAFREDITVKLTEYSKRTTELKKLQEEVATIKASELADDDKLAKLNEIMTSTAFVESSAFSTETLPKLAYIMYLEANVPVTEIFGKLSEEGYLTWLITMDQSDISDNLSEILAIWRDGARTTSKPKN